MALPPKISVISSVGDSGFQSRETSFFYPSAQSSSVDINQAGTQTHCHTDYLRPSTCVGQCVSPVSPTPGDCPEELGATYVQRLHVSGVTSTSSSDSTPNSDTPDLSNVSRIWRPFQTWMRLTGAWSWLLWRCSSVTGCCNLGPWRCSSVTGCCNPGPWRCSSVTGVVTLDPSPGHQ